MDASDLQPPRPLNPFEKFVAAIAAVPKAEVDAEQAKSKGKPPSERDPKPKPAA
jgi:hypothetical protein